MFVLALVNKLGIILLTDEFETKEEAEKEGVRWSRLYPYNEILLNDTTIYNHGWKGVYDAE